MSTNGSIAWLAYHEHVTAKWLNPCLCVTAILMAQAVAAPNLRSEDSEVSPREALTTALRELTDEAREAQKSGTLPRLKADYAAQFPHQIDSALIKTKLLRPVGRDPFIDAYIRWQLTSFVDALPEMDDAEFEKFLSELSACVLNPQVSEKFVQPLMRASSAGELAPSDHKYVQNLIDDLKAQREQASVLRRPADELRAWIAKHVGENGHRPMQVAIERCAALAQAGWDLREMKEELTLRCEAALRDRSLSEEQRQRVARQLQNLAQFSALRINDAYLRDGSLIVNTESSGVYDYEARQWARTILRQ
jgi:hypothetical protein